MPDIFQHWARIVPQSRAIQPEGIDLAALARDRAFDSSILDERPPFFWLAEISSNRLDAYFTRMTPKTLRNFADDANDGVSFQNSHRNYELALGRSLWATTVEEADEVRALSWFYTIPALRLNEVTTDDFITGLRAGIINDVSVGFYGGEMRCSICGRSLWDWDCDHIPGLKYDIRDPKGDLIGQELAIAWIDDAHLSEVSAVYDGATPGAAVMKAQREADAGRMKQEAARILEARYRIRLPVTTQHAPPTRTRVIVPRHAEQSTGTALPAAPQQEREIAMPTDDEHVSNETESEPKAQAPLVADLRMVILQEIAGLGAPGADAIDQVRWVATELKRIRGENETLRSLADDGRRYRADLVDEALAEGVRANGITFAQDIYRPVLENASLETIKRIRDDWRVAGDKLFAGGRVTTDDSTNTGKKPTVPNRVHQG